MQLPFNGYVEWDEDEYMGDAQWVAWTLAGFYPDHPWHIRAYKNGFYVGRLDLPEYAVMNFPRLNKVASASEYKKIVCRMGGEFLERANMIRGRLREGEEMTKLEGVPEKKTAEIEHIEIAQPNIREKLMPQVTET